LLTGRKTRSARGPLMPAAWPSCREALPWTRCGSWCFTGRPDPASATGARY